MNFSVTVRRELDRLQQRVLRAWNGSQGGGAFALPDRLPITRNLRAFQAHAVSVARNRNHTDQPRARTTGFITVVLLIGIGLLTFGIRSVVDGSKPDRVATSDEPAAVPADMLPATDISDGRGGSDLVLVSGVPLFPLEKNREIQGDVNAPFIAQRVSVLSIAGDKGFWLGVSSEQRVFVTIPQDLNNGSLTLSQLTPGQQLSVFGRTAEAPYDTAVLGLSGTDAELLTSQKRVIVANSISAM